MRPIVLRQKEPENPEYLARKTLRSQLKTKFRILQLAVIDANNWMAMVMLPNQADSLRFRCTDGMFVDERTVGD